VAGEAGKLGGWPATAADDVEDRLALAHKISFRVFPQANPMITAA
jgi:hypothetical protein